MISARGRGISLKTVVDGPGYESKTNGAVHFLDASAILDVEQLHVFVTNRSLDQTATVEIGLADRDIKSVRSAEVLTGPDAKAFNSFEKPDQVTPRPFSEYRLENGRAEQRDASDLWGRDANEAEHALQARHGKGTEVAVIGQSGERLTP